MQTNRFDVRSHRWDRAPCIRTYSDTFDGAFDEALAETKQANVFFVEILRGDECLWNSHDGYCD